MNNKINIDTKTFVRFWLVVIGFGLAGLAIYKSLPALLIIGLSFFLAIALNPSVNYIAKHLSSKSRVTSTAISYIVVLLALGGILFLVVPPVVEQTTKFVSTVPSLIDSATGQYAVVNEFVNRYNLQPQVDDVIKSLKTGATQFASGIGTNLIAGIGSVLTIAASIIIVLVLTFLMLIEGPAWLDRIWGLYRNKDKMEHHRGTVQRMYSVVTGYVTGQLTVSSIDGALAGVVVFILSLTAGVPANLVLPTAAIIFIMSLIPLFGAALGGILMSLVLAVNSPTAALIFFLYFFLYQQVENNFIAPKIQSKKLNLSPLIVLVAITTGVIVFGIIGGIISIPIAGCIRILIDNYFGKSSNKTKLDVNSIV